MSATPEQRLEAARRAAAGLQAMLASSIATGEALERLGDETLIDTFKYLSAGARVIVKLVTDEIAKLER